MQPSRKQSRRRQRRHAYRKYHTRDESQRTGLEQLEARLLLSAVTTDDSEDAGATGAPPDAVNDQIVAVANVPFIAQVLNNDSDPDEDPLTITGYTQGSQGAVSDNGDGTLTYKATPAAIGFDSFQYTITDGNGNFDSATVNVIVINANSAPIVQTPFEDVTVTTESADELQVFLLLGQSNMQGHAYPFYLDGDALNVPSIEFLLDSTPAAQTYFNTMPDHIFTFKPHLEASWLGQRDDVWAVQYRSSNGSLEQVEPTTNPATWTTGIEPLGPGFGSQNGRSSFGPELAMGQRLGDGYEAPVFLFKSNEGGTTLAEDWRPPSAVAARGGTVGANYTNTMNRFISFLDDLDADLADDGKLNDYADATGYRVAGVVWFQGWNEQFNGGIPEYDDNLVDLIHDIRAADSRIPDDTAIIIPESADQNFDLNLKRVDAVEALNAEIPGSAVFFENNQMINRSWGNNNSGSAFSSSQGYHFNRYAQNYLEVGWRTGGAAADMGLIPDGEAQRIIDLAEIFLDADDDPEEMAYTIEGNTNAALFNATIDGTLLSLDYNLDQFGTTDITIRATDTGGLFVEDTFTFTRIPDNLPGDTDGDGDIDTADLTTAIQNFNGAGGTGKTVADGDTDGDGDVDTADLTYSISHFTGAAAALADVQRMAFALTSDSQTAWDDGEADGGATNQPPTAVDDNSAATAGVDKILYVLGNDTDPENDPLTIHSFTQPPQGEVTDNGDGTLTYASPLSAEGLDSFEYTITDGNGNFDTAAVSVFVVNNNTAPTVATPIDDIATDQSEPEKLQVFLLAGQSNMQGHAYTFYQQGNNFNVPTIEFLNDSTPAALNYVSNLPPESFTFKDAIDPTWLAARNDVWAIQYQSGNGTIQRAEPTSDPNTWTTRIAPLSPGFGASNNNNNYGSFGPELGFGIGMGDAYDAPVLLFKSNRGGTTLAEDWRPPTAVASRGGVIGPDYSNTMQRFIELLDDLDADLADDGVLNDYNNATGYEVAGFVWVQGYNEQFNNKIPEYADNLVDLVHDIRAADARIPGDLGIVIGESADQSEPLNVQRRAAADTLNAEIPNTAMFFETNNMLNQNWGNGNSGAPFSSGEGYHFNNHAQNYLEVGWRSAQGAIENGFVNGGENRRIIELAAVFADAESDVDELTITIESNTNPSLVTATIDGLDLILTYAPGKGGTADITIRATDSAGKFVEDTFTVTRLPQPGDTDGDGDIDTADLNTAIGNFTGAGGSGKTRFDGDTDDDGDVDTHDLNQSIANFTGAAAAARADFEQTIRPLSAAAAEPWDDAQSDADAANSPPVAINDNGVVIAGQSTELDVFSNDSDPDGDPLSIDSFTLPSKGNLTHLGNGEFIYTSNGNSFGYDTFEYTVTDGNGGFATGVVRVYVVDPNTRPRIVKPIDDFTVDQPESDKLQVFLLAGQSNMQGHAYTFYQQGNGFNVPTIEFLNDNTPAAINYRNNMPRETFTFLDALDPSWAGARDDVWAIQYQSGNGTAQRAEPTADSSGWTSSIAPLSPGFGASNNNNNYGSFGPELGFGFGLGNAYEAPVLLFKSNRGGTTLAEDWRPPTAVADRGGVIGPDYSNTMQRFLELLDELDADLADDGLLNGYNNATGYEIAGFFWVQGYNEQFNNKIPEYADNLVDLVHDIRAADARIPDDLGIIIGESTDQNVQINAKRAEAAARLNAEIPGSAVFYETNGMIGGDWGNNNSGSQFNLGNGYHFNMHAQNYLEVGWRAANAVIGGSFIDGGESIRIIELAEVFADEQTPTRELTLSIRSNNNPSLVSATLDGTDLVLTYAEGKAGTATIKVRATDPEGRYVEDTFTLTRLPQPGDTDGDGDIDTADITTAIANYNGAGGTGKTRFDGDTDDDGDVDTHDLTQSIINFTGADEQVQALLGMLRSLNVETTSDDEGEGDIANRALGADDDDALFLMEV